MHRRSLAPDCFDIEDTQVDPISVVAAVVEAVVAAVVIVAEILVVAVVGVALMVGASFDPFSIMTCKQSVMETNLVK